MGFLKRFKLLPIHPSSVSHTPLLHSLKSVVAPLGFTSAALLVWQKKYWYRFFSLCSLLQFNLLYGSVEAAENS